MKRFVRELTENDLSLVIEIENRAFPDPWPRQAFEDLISQYAMVLEVEDRLCGYIIYHEVPREAVILNFAIDPELQRQGHGEYLLRQSIKRLRDRGCTLFFLDVRESNQAAIELYKKFGFSVLGIRKGYYRDPPEDAVVMGLVQIGAIKE